MAMGTMKRRSLAALRLLVGLRTASMNTVLTAASLFLAALLQRVIIHMGFITTTMMKREMRSSSRAALPQRVIIHMGSITDGITTLPTCQVALRQQV